MPIQSQKIIKFLSFLTVLLEIQYRNQNRKKKGTETKVSLIFPIVSQQPNGETHFAFCIKGLSFFFFFLQRPRRLKELKAL